MTIKHLYPTSRPSLDLNFARDKKLDPRITYSRSSSGTYVDAAGVLQSAATNVARFDHNPSTGESLGLLVEEARTNLWNYSANPTFVAAGGSVTPYSELAPDGTYTASTFVPSAASDSTDRYLVVPRSNTLSTQQTVTLYVKTTYFYLVFFSNGEGSQSNVAVNVGINLLTNSVYQTTSTNGTYTSSSITNVANGYKKISITYQTDGGVGGKQPGIIVSDTQFTIIGNPGRASDQTANYTTDGIKSLTIWGVQLETGSFPTSYIPTPATFTGRTSTATYYDANGVIQTALSGVARSNAYFPDSSGVMRSAGLLLEAAATNLTLNSEAFPYLSLNEVSWIANSTQAPDQATTADKLVPVLGYSSHKSEITPRFAGTNSDHTFSVFVKKEALRYAYVAFFANIGSRYGVLVDLDTGTVVQTYSSGSPLNTAHSVQRLANGWYRISVTKYWDSTENLTRGVVGATDTYPNSFPSGNVSYVADGVSGMYFWGAQLEASSYPTSYIPTAGATVTRSADTSTSATVTRSADVAQMTGTNFSSWFNSSEGCVAVQHRLPVVYTDNATVLTIKGDSANTLYMRANNSEHFTILSAGAVSTQIKGGGNYAANTLNLVAGGYALNDFRVSTNGSLSALDTSGLSLDAATTSMTQLGLGAAGANPGTSNTTLTISRLTYYPARLPDATLQTLTK